MKTEFIVECLRTHYEIKAATLAKLSVGADINASIYKVQDSAQQDYFVKLKVGDNCFDHSEILELLKGAGIQHLILPIKTREGKEVFRTEDFSLVVYPFVSGQDGFHRCLTKVQWIELGRSLKQLHEIAVPPFLQNRIRREEFSPKWREDVRSCYAHMASVEIRDENALSIWSFLTEKRSIIHQLVDRAEQFGQKARRQPLKFVLCHADIHGGNILIDDKEDFYIVDWDDPMLAPKERDLMFIGGGVGNVWNNPHEEALFYQGYGQVEVDLTLLAYYRHERIIEDIAIYAQELLFKPAKGEDRREMYEALINQFAPNGVVDIAMSMAEP